MPKRKIEIFFFLFLSRLQTKNNLRSLNPFTPPARSLSLSDSHSPSPSLSSHSQGTRQKKFEIKRKAKTLEERL